MSEEVEVGIVIPSNPEDLKKLRAGVEEIVNSMTRVASESEYQKESVTELAKKFDVPKKFVKLMATDTFKMKFEKESNERSDYESLYESVMEGA